MKDIKNTPETVEDESYKTERTYMDWMVRFKDYCGKADANEVADGDVRNYLTHLAVSQKVAASTQNQAFNAILFFFRHVLGREMGDMRDNVRAKRPLRLPLVSCWHNYIIHNRRLFMNEFKMPDPWKKEMW